MKRQYRVNVFDPNADDQSVRRGDPWGPIVARVRYNANLDHWDGRNFTCGQTGRHKGITKLKDGRYVLIHGTDWVDENDWAEVVDEETALQEVLKSGHLELLDTKKFRGLAELFEKITPEEEEDDEEE